MQPTDFYLEFIFQSKMYKLMNYGWFFSRGSGHQVLRCQNQYWVVIQSQQRTDYIQIYLWKWMIKTRVFVIVVVSVVVIYMMCILLNIFMFLFQKWMYVVFIHFHLNKAKKDLFWSLHEHPFSKGNNFFLVLKAKSHS